MAILITGASKGLGRAICEVYAELGHKVVGCSRGASDLSHPNYLEFAVDVTNDEDIRKMFRDIKRRGVVIETLIHCAGLSQSSLALMTSTAQARQIMDVNFVGTFNVTKQAAKSMMLSGFGRVIALSSVNVALHNKGGCIYNASKAACENLVKTLTSEFSVEDITFNAIGLPIVANTGMAESLSKAAVLDKRSRLDKSGDAQISEVVHVIDFLRHPQSGKVSGQTIYLGAP